jgi:DNA (cytosine-5)-methyltransferase 1
MTRPRLLDLFCGAGGSAVGYQRAGFDVVGVDIVPQPAYPSPDVLQGDAMLVLDDAPYCRSFDVIHTSPPCQAYTALRTRQHRWITYPELVTPVRQRLVELGVPWVIENVPGAPLRDPVILCGSMFGLGLVGYTLRRHRLFESSMRLAAPPDACAGRRVVGVYGTGGAWTRTAPGGGGVKVSGVLAARALGIEHTTRTDELAQAIPPAYTEHLGRQLVEALA